MCARNRLKTLAVTILFVVASGIFLVACGGGGNGNGMPDPEPGGGGGEPGDQMRITPLVEYGSFAYFTSPSDDDDAPFGFIVTAKGTSQSEARDAALAECEEDRRSGDSNCQEVLWFRNACGASAVGFLEKAGEPQVTGVGWGTSGSIAEQNAIAACRTAAGGDSIGDSCEIDKSECAQAGSATPTGEASTIPPTGGTPTPPTGGTPTPPPEEEDPPRTYAAYSYATRIGGPPIAILIGRPGESEELVENRVQAECSRSFARGTCEVSIAFSDRGRGEICVAGFRSTNSRNGAYVVGGGVGSSLLSAQRAAERDCESNIGHWNRRVLGHSNVIEVGSCVLSTESSTGGPLSDCSR